MKRIPLFIAVVCLVVPGLAPGQTPPPAPALGIAGPTILPQFTLGQYAVKGGEAKVAWLVLPQTSQIVLDQQLVMTGAPGTYTVLAFAVVNGQPSILQQAVIVQGTVPPIPPAPPVPPGPNPPVPPEPPAPIPDAGLRVLIIYETSELSKLPPPQRLSLYDQSLRDYLSSVTVQDPRTHVPEWRVLDKDTALAPGVPDVWKRLLARPHPTLPWLIVGNGTSGYEGPLPATAAETKAIVSKFAGK